MKLLILLVSFIAIVSATTDEELWMKFKQDHLKTYKSLREDKLRFGIFKSNLETIKSHNAKFANGEETWEMGVNSFADLTDEEFEALYLSEMPKVNSPSKATFTLPPGASVPDSVDWREKGAVRSVKTQGNCPGTWAFSAIDALEGQNAIKHNSTDDLSVQELIDCASAEYHNAGCQGGFMDRGFLYVQDHGISKLVDYPYVAKDEECKSRNNTAKIKLTGFVDLPQEDEESMKQAVGTIGPISVAIRGNVLRFYKSGIFNFAHCMTPPNFGVSIVGYGTENGLDYWIVKNSWGPSFGENGYLRMVRHTNICGIAIYPSYPVIE